MENVTDPDTFYKELGTLIGQIRAQAVETKNEGLGKGKTKLSTFVTLNALVQCTKRPISGRLCTVSGHC